MVECNSDHFRRMNGKPSNLPSGTVVDSEREVGFFRVQCLLNIYCNILLRYDFFLVAHFVNQGTLNPTSNNVVKNTSGLLPKHIQALTYKLTYLHYNWPGSIGVPAPCQYSHKLAFLVSISISCT